MNNRLKKIACIALMFCVNGLAFAQKLHVETTVTDGKVVSEGNKYHALVGATATYRVTITDIPETDVLDEAHQFKIESSQISSCAGSLSTGFTFSKKFDNKINGDFVFSVKVSYKRGGETVELSAEGNHVQIYDAPSSISVTDAKKQYLDKASYSVNITPSGGNPSGWKYTLDDKETSSNSITINKPTTVPNDHTYIVKAINYAPDGKTVWFSTDYSYPIYFYDTPTVNIASSSSKETNFYKNTGNAEWKIERKGGSTEWTITWTGGTSEGKGESYKPYTADVTSTQANRTLSYTAVNTYEGVELFRKSEEVATINVFKAASYSKGDIESMSVYKGEKVSFCPTDESIPDCPAQWSYAWSDGITKTKSFTTSAQETTSYSVVAEYKYNDQVWDSYTYKYSVTAYDHPSVSAAMDVKLNDYEGTEHVVNQNATVSYPSYSSNGGSYSILVGDKIEFNFTTTNGASKWSYSIIDSEGNDYGKLSTARFTATKAGTYTFTMKATNGEGIVANPYKATITKTFVVYPVPTLDVTNLTHNIFSGEKLIYELPSIDNTENSNWKCDWTSSDPSAMTVNGDNLTISKEVSSHEILTYTLAISYVLEGIKRLDKTASYTAQIWPAPTATLNGTIHAVNYMNTIEDIALDNSTVTYTDKETEGSMRYLVKGDKANINIETKDGIDGSWNYIIKEGDKVLGNSNSLEYIPETEGDHMLTIEISNGTGIADNPYHATIKRKFRVCGKPSVNNANQERHSIPGTKESFACQVSGGDDNGWSYEWNNGSKERILNITTNDVSSKYSEQYSCKVKNMCEGVMRFEDTRLFTLVTWPAPSVASLVVKLRDKEINEVKDIKYYDLLENSNNDNISIECFDGDILDIAFSIKGGYTAESDNWTYTNSLRSSENIEYAIDANLSDLMTDTYLASSDSEKTEKSFTLNFRNTPGSANHTNSNVWYDRTFRLDVTTWKNGEIQDNAKDSISYASWKVGDRIDVYAGGQPSNDVNFNVSHSYGKDGAWSYVWKDNGVVASTNDTEYTYIPETKDSYTDHVFTLNVINKIGDNYSFKTTKRYYARVWKKATMPTDFTMVDVNNDGRIMTGDYLAVRKGNKVHIDVDPIVNGYRGSNGNSESWYNYIWSNPFYNGQRSWTMIADPGNMSNMKEKKDMSCDLVAESWGPYGKLWDSSEKSYNYTVYNKPETPLSLTKMGNGASGTAICTVNMSDTELEKRQYFLVFGYIDANGKLVDHINVEQVNDGHVRWDKGFTQEQLKNLYVYALWRYDDGTEITSGIRYLNSTDEDWDDSEYSGKIRSAIARWFDNVDGIDIVTTEYGFKTQEIYNADGIRTSNLGRGLNIIKEKGGRVHKVIKR